MKYMQYDVQYLGTELKQTRQQLQ